MEAYLHWICHQFPRPAHWETPRAWNRVFTKIHDAYTMMRPMTVVVNMTLPLLVRSGLPAAVSMVNPPTTNRNDAIKGTIANPLLAEPGNKKKLMMFVPSWNTWQRLHGSCPAPPQGIKPLAASAKLPTARTPTTIIAINMKLLISPLYLMH